MTLSSGASETLRRCQTASDAGIGLMRQAAKELFEDERRFIIGANGSYARREVTSGSDVDLFFLTIDDDPNTIVYEQARFRDRLTELEFKLPASDGVFSNPLSVKTTRDTIGGQEDSNESITRRMLLLLEGEWVFNEVEFNKTREILLNKYISDDLRPDQICMFLLNDIIRYWRTICVDFEYKSRGGEKAKAIRLIKLRFSRMMLYLAGILAVGETCSKQPADKRTELLKLLGMPPLQRFTHIVGDVGNPMLELYAEFLKALDDKDVREKLDQRSPEGEKTEEFTVLRQKAHTFRDHVHELLVQHYSDGNPTLAALML